MKMIPLVMANEPGKAQLVNRGLRLRNCSLDMYYQCWAGCKSFWKNTSERVRIPYARSDPSAFGVQFRVAYFGNGAQSGR
jgi:hypothetical protein